jgi:predicted nucleotidyltransferase
MAEARQALERLRAAAEDGRLEQLCRRHGIRILGVFGSTLDPDRPNPGDLDIAVEFERDVEGDIVAVVNDLIDLTRFTDIDVLNLSRARANPVARTSGLVGEPLYESEPGAYARAQLHAVRQHLDTRWLRRLDLELLAS